MPRRAAVLLLLTPFGCLGCFSASSAGSAPDAGFDQQNDADFTDTGTLPEASQDASVDSSMDVTVVEAAADAPVEAGPQPVTVLVTNATGPEPGVPVVFQQATGAVIGSATTSAAGTVSQLQSSDIQVTVVMGTSAAPLLFTIEGVAPGDALTVYDPSADAQLGAVSIDSLPAGAPAGVVNYAARIGNCSGFAAVPPISVTLGAGCQYAGKFPVLVTAFGGVDAGNAALGVTWQKGNALESDGGTTHVTMSGTWSMATNTQTVTTDSPPAFAAASGDNGYLGLSAIATGVAAQRSNTYYGGIGADEGGVSSAYPYLAGFPDFLQGEANVSDYGLAAGNAGVSVTAMATRGAAPAGDGTTSLDISTLLPQIQTASIDSTTSAVQPTVSWDMGDAGSVTAADGVVVAFTWSGNNDGSFTTGQWTIVGPPTASSIQAPALPAAQADFAPFAGALFGNEPAVIIVEASFLSGYAQLRAQAGTAALTSQFNTNLSYSSSNPTVVPPLPVNGTLRLTAFTANGD